MSKKDDMKQLEKDVHHKIKTELSEMKDILAKAVFKDNFSLLMGEEELIEEFCELLIHNDIKPEIDYVMIGATKEKSQPIRMIRQNRKTGERKINTIVLIRKTKKLENFFMGNILECNSTNPYKNIDKLMSIELYADDMGRSVISHFLEEEFTEENIKNDLCEYFNIEKTFGEVVKNIKRDKENESIMYG